MKNFIIAVCAIMLMGTAQAQLIDVGGTEYDILWEIGTFDEVNTARNLEGQIWWGDGDLAGTFASSLGYIDVGHSDIFILNLDVGPLFAYEFPETGAFRARSSMSGFTTTGLRTHDRIVWAYERSTIPTPGSLTLIVLGLAGLGVTRKVRR